MPEINDSEEAERADCERYISQKSITMGLSFFRPWTGRQADISQKGKTRYQIVKVRVVNQREKMTQVKSLDLDTVT